jgi:hypothetical protein
MFLLKDMLLEKKQMHIVKIYDDYNEGLKEVVSFNHCTRALTVGESSDIQVKELVHKAVNIGDELVTELCPRLARKNGD